MIDLGNITLRNWQEIDVKSLSKNANNRNIWNNLRDEFPFPYTELAAEEWIKISNQNKPLTNFAIEYKGKALFGSLASPDWAPLALRHRIAPALPLLEIMYAIIVSTHNLMYVQTLLL